MNNEVFNSEARELEVLIAENVLRIFEVSAR